MTTDPAAKPPGTDSGGGRLFVLSGPSGAGKTTLCRLLRRRMPDLVYSVSYTTRSPRRGETDGVDYHFVSRSQFEQGMAAGRWAEWALVHGNYYGTSAEFLESRLAGGQDVLMDIDVQGAAKILAAYPQGITIFVMPPSLECLQNRLNLRALDGPAVIATRLANAQAEMAASSRYRHVIVNDCLDAAGEALAALVGRYRGAGDDRGV
jgi:guanylate kinase